MALSPANAIFSASWLAAGSCAAVPAPPIEFNRDIRPILSDHCFRCHGPDAAARKAGLRLDLPDLAKSVLKSGHRAIVPGDAKSSELLHRIDEADPDEVMPPPSINLPLSVSQRQTLRNWILAGAEYQPHWAFVPPKAVDPPAVREANWPRDPIDRFVLAKLEYEGLPHGAEADRATLLRRAAMVLTGVPPTLHELDEFQADKSTDAYEKQVDRLLASPAYGERMAVDWLDAARFADTYGYQSDWECRVWPWRDWVINSFNADTPYDRFITEQLAGDLLPDATDSQRVATAFNRLHRQTNEGGSIDAEFRQEYISDRVHTFGTAILGLTLECARCHEHKYDPISQRDYYSICSFFGAIDEAGTYPYTTGATPRPAMRLPTPEQRAELARLDTAVATAQASLAEARSSAAQRAIAWLKDGAALAHPAPAAHHALEGNVDSPAGKAMQFDGDAGVVVEGAPSFRRCDAYSLSFWMFSPEPKERATILHTSRFTIEADEQGYQVLLRGGRLSWEVVHYWPGSAAAVQTVRTFPTGQWVHVCVTYDGSSTAKGLRIFLDGKPESTEVLHDHLDGPATSRALQVGYRDRDIGFKDGRLADLNLFDRELSPLEAQELFKPGSLRTVIANASPGDTNTQYLLHELFVRAIDEPSRVAARALRDARAAQQDLLESIPELMVMEDAPKPRPSYVLKRGRYDDPDHLQQVMPDRVVDSVLPMAPALPRNRLGLANWTTDPRNPLVARAEVNRLWSMCFGRGLVLTQENLGSQGDPPSHPELLDTLAREFIQSGWKVKSLLRRIVLSATFRQASDFTPDTLAKDPSNKLLSRGPSWRLSSEALRDQALAASGLLDPTIGGPSVKPWQPPGLWEDAGANAQGNGGYVPDTGPSSHRRSLYTYRKRTAPPPNMLAFDSGSRELCLARRQATNTPLQPLVLMNDLVYWECCRALAARSMKHAGADLRSQVAFAFRSLTSRLPRPAEAAALEELFRSQHSELISDPASTASICAPESPDPSLAALTLVCSAILASDATVTLR